MKKQKVKLSYVKNKKTVEKDFDYDHASRLMSYEQETNRIIWRISDGQNLIFKDGNIIAGPSTKRAKSSE